MDTILIILGIFLLICTHIVAYNIGGVKAYDKLDKDLMKIKDEL